jgi:bifunctional DNA-binding transcriptional regulator/antitoxin component of YhaV-PrlF toxin-antitoxin module
MSKVTSKLQVTIPKALATRYGIAAGDEVQWAAAGDALRLELAQQSTLRKTTIEDRLYSFDQATQRQQSRQTQSRQTQSPIAVAPTGIDRGWAREELYDRGGAD